MARCLLISAPASGAGKTTLTLALARAFRDRGLSVQCFKSGPDYIDPAFHAAATGRASVNIDSWAMSREEIEKLVARGGDAGLVLAEGSMGLFDGVATPGRSGTGASADIAAMMGWPVLLVLDPAGQAQTAAAVASGLRDFRNGVHIAGVVLNRVASPRHEDLVRKALVDAGIAVACADRVAGTASRSRAGGRVVAAQ
jgi:cobyrinic acid a,c-diamide synthase